MTTPELLQPDAPEVDFQVLTAELASINKEQLDGKWNHASNYEAWATAAVKAGADTPSLEGFDSWVASRIRRGIELTAILRRSNTGPAKSKTGTPRKSKKIDLDAIREEFTA